VAILFLILTMNKSDLIRPAQFQVREIMNYSNISVGRNNALCKTTMIL